MIPVLSSISYGPLGLCHLPRFWWKGSLKTKGLLAPDYPEFSSGLDKLLLEKLGIASDDVQFYIGSCLPNYLQFEKWVLGHAEGCIGSKVVAEWNQYIQNRIHKRPGKLADIYGTLGWEVDGSTFPSSREVLPTSAVILNHLEDWHFFFYRDLSGDTLCSFKNAVIPLISSLDYGMLGVCQLPRTWQKVLLETKGLLKSGYPGCGDGLDRRVIEDVLGLGKEHTVSYLQNHLPDYLTFETWVRGEMKGRDVGLSIKEWNTFVRNRDHNEEKRSGIFSSLGCDISGEITSAVVLNHLEDWHFAHEAIVAA